MRPMVPPTRVDENGQRVGHVLKALDLPFQFLDMALREALDFSALPGFVAPEPKEVTYFGDRKPEIACPANEAQHMYVGVGVVAIA